MEHATDQINRTAIIVYTEAMTAPSARLPRLYRALLFTAAVMLAIGGMYGFIRLRYTFQGVVLPLVAIDSLPHPPPAWLIVDNTAIPATFGDYCWHHPLWGGECVTASKAEEIPDLATVTLPPNHAPVIVVDLNRQLLFFPSLRPWNRSIQDDPGSRRTLEGSDTRGERFTTFTLQPLVQVENQVLEVQVMPTGTKRVTYLWHLNP